MHVLPNPSVFARDYTNKSIHQFMFWLVHGIFKKCAILFIKSPILLQVEFLVCIYFIARLENINIEIIWRNVITKPIFQNIHTISLRCLEIECREHDNWFSWILCNYVHKYHLTKKLKYKHSDSLIFLVFVFYQPNMYVHDTIPKSFMWNHKQKSVLEKKSKRNIVWFLFIYSLVLPEQ